LKALLLALGPLGVARGGVGVERVGVGEGDGVGDGKGEKWAIGAELEHAQTNTAAARIAVRFRI
jgi:hypothetical protein